MLLLSFYTLLAFILAVNSCIYLLSFYTCWITDRVGYKSVFLSYAKIFYLAVGLLNEKYEIHMPEMYESLYKSVLLKMGYRSQMFESHI